MHVINIRRWCAPYIYIVYLTVHSCVIYTDEAGAPLPDGPEIDQRLLHQRRAHRAAEVRGASAAGKYLCMNL